MWLRCRAGRVFRLCGIAGMGTGTRMDFRYGDEDAYLVFGVPELDDAGISFGCTLQSGEIRMFIPEAGEDLKPDEKIKLTVRAAARTFVYDGLDVPQ